MKLHAPSVLRHRRRLKWLFLTASAVIATAMLITFVGTIEWTVNWWRFDHHGKLTAGSIIVNPGEYYNWRISWFSRPLKIWLVFPNIRRVGNHSSVEIPLWLILTPLTVVTAVLFRLDPRQTSCCCRKCGYNLTGNESGVCPECGTVVALAPRKSDRVFGVRVRRLKKISLVTCIMLGAFMLVTQFVAFKWAVGGWFPNHTGGVHWSAVGLKFSENIEASHLSCEGKFSNRAMMLPRLSWRKSKLRVTIPLWMFLAPLTGLTVWFYRRDRQAQSPGSSI